MKWEGGRESGNVEDRRGAGGGLPAFGARGIGIGTIVLALVGGWIFGINPLTILSLLSGGGGAPAVQQAPAQRPPVEDQLARFVSVVLADTEDVWNAQFRAQGAQYREPKLVLFTGAVPTACGQGAAAMGPFYCPGDEKVYIDLGFYDTLKSRLGAPGDFAQAYVIAHEVGHHVQNLMGITGKVDEMRRQLPEARANALSVRVELQADCLAGVWAHHAQKARQIIEQGDVEEALAAAAAIGDDTLQKRGRGQVVPESFTHGTSDQRVRWFRAGMDGGSVKQCNTFEAKAL